MADAVRGNWVDRRAPAGGAALPAAVARRPADRDLAAAHPLLVGPPARRGGGPGGLRPFDLWIAAGCALGAVLMRGAGCTWNDLTDRDFDARVARTRSRPLPSGQVTPRQAAAWMVAQALAAFAILLSFPPRGGRARRRLAGAGRGLPLRQALHLVAAGLPRARLQLGRAARLGGARARARAGAALLLYAAGIAWTLFYDTIYAHQDREDDALIGVKSTARLFGTRDEAAGSRGFLVAAAGAGGARRSSPPGSAGAALARRRSRASPASRRTSAGSSARLDIDDPARLPDALPLQPRRRADPGRRACSAAAIAVTARSA